MCMTLGGDGGKRIPPRYLVRAIPAASRGYPCMCMFIRLYEQVFVLM